MSVIGPVALSLMAGVLSFTSPCCLPLMPGYLSYVSGVIPDGAGAVATRRRVLGAALLFVLGFSVVFTLLGATASAAGSFLLQHRLLLERVGGVVVIVMGLVFMGALRIPALSREVRFDLRRIPTGPAGAVPLGMAFAVGWTPCVGPVLAGVLAAAATTGSVGVGAGLLFVYSLGLGIPFVVLALAQARAARTFAWFRRHARGVELAGGAVLVTMGALMFTGQWIRLFAPLLRWYARTGWPPI